MRNDYVFPIAFGLVAAGSLFDLMQLPARSPLGANLTVLTLLVGAALAFGELVLNWRFYKNLPRSWGRSWMRREFGFILIAEIVLLYSLAARTGNARLTVVPVMLSGLGMLVLALAALCRLKRLRLVHRSAVESDHQITQPPQISGA